MSNTALYHKAVDLLKALIQTPSLSGEEDKTADLITEWLNSFNIKIQRVKNNVWAVNKHFAPNKPSILINSHHDTVKPNKAYTNNPFEAKVDGDKLYGLGSNDAGGCLVSLMVLFVHFYEKVDLNYNLILAATAEEEISGKNGIQSVMPELPTVDFALVGEPTSMQMAVAEKGLMVIDGIASGTAGHSAHVVTEENAIYKAMDDINWISRFEFPKVSDLLGKVKMTVSQINAGEQHNLVPSECNFVLDVRVNEMYTNKEVFDIINANTKSTVQARSFRLNPSSIPLEHPIVKAGEKLGLKTIGSPTLSDQALLNCPSIKMGPGDTKRSHQADEFIHVNEIEEGINGYINLFNQLLNNNE